MSFRSVPESEERLLLDAVRAEHDTIRLPSRIDVERLLLLTDRHRVAGLLENLLDAPTPAETPAWVPAVRDALRERRDRNARAFLDQMCTLVAVGGALDRVGAEHLILKGPTLVRLYRHETDRDAGDLDVLLRHEHTAEAAIDELIADGWRAANRWADWRPRWRRAYMQERKDLSLSREGGYSRLELHWRTFKDHRIAPQDPFQDTVTRQAGGRSFPGMCEVDEAAYLLRHGTVHGWARLKWQADIVRADEALGPSGARAARQQAFSDENHDAVLLIDGMTSDFGLKSTNASPQCRKPLVNRRHVRQRLHAAVMMDLSTPPRFIRWPFRPSIRFRVVRFVLMTTLHPAHDPCAHARKYFAAWANSLLTTVVRAWRAPIRSIDTRLRQMRARSE